MLRPGQATLADWRGIYRGLPVVFDPVSRADIEAGAAALLAIHAREAEMVPAADLRNIEGEADKQPAEPLPAALVRLVLGLKLASLGQGASGVGWNVVQRLSDFLSRNMLPVMPNRADGAALASIEAAVAGKGEIAAGGKRHDAAEAHAEAELQPLELSQHERAALRSGAEVATAFGLAGLFEAERAFQSGLVAATLTAAVSGRTQLSRHPRVLRLSRQTGLSEVAAAFPKLMDNGKATKERANGKMAPMTPGLRGGEAEMGACLDLLRQAGGTLTRQANTVSEDRLVFWQSEEVAEGIPNAASGSVAADLIALALREISALSERRIVILSAAGARGGETGNSTPLSMATAFLGEIKERAFPIGLALEEANGTAFATAGVRRLLPMAGTVALVVLIEFLAAAKALGAAGQRPISEALEPVLLLLGERLPMAPEEQITAVDLAIAADLVRSGALAAAPGIDLPSVVTALPRALAI